MKTLLVYGALLAAFTIAACYPDNIDRAEELDTVTTLFNQQGNFSTIKRYVIPDTVLHLPDEGNIPRSVDGPILERVRTNMNAAGYVEETDPAAHPPDVVMLTAVSTAENIIIAYDYWGYWGWYPYWPWYGGGWGWGYPPTTTAYSYQTGTVLLTLVDARNVDTTAQTVPVLWTAAANGVLTGTLDASRALNGIDKAFEQSPYLRAQ